MKLNDYVVKNSKLSDVAHSSGYAKVQSGERLGATSSQTFSQRQSIDYRKSVIKSYGDSNIARTRVSQRDVSKNSLSALDQIRQKRAEREQNFGVSKNEMNMRLANKPVNGASSSRKSVRNFGEVSQSGVAGFHAGSSSASSSSAVSQSFRPPIRPHF